MKLFSGFATGRVEVTPLPNQFFSELLPAIDDLAELKVTLHMLWLSAHSKAVYARASDLRADRTLMQSLAATDDAPAQALERALDSATQRGALLRLNIPADGETAGDDLYFLNTEPGRRAIEKMQSTGIPRSQPGEPVAIAERPNIFALYEKNIGLLTPMLAEELKDAEQQYPAEWIAEAIKIAVENNKRSWSYARRILERWKTEGRADKSKSKSWYGDKYGKFVKR
jgi:DnaD/phage-associated family protein